MTHPMTLVHEARRLRPLFGKNPFVTEASLLRLVDRLWSAYMAAKSDRVSQALKVEIDLLEMIV